MFWLKSLNYWFKNFHRRYKPWYCSIFTIDVEGLSNMKLCFPRVKWLSFPHMKYSIKVVVTDFIYITLYLLFVHAFLFWLLGRFSCSHKSCLCESYSVSQTVSEEICFAALDVASCKHNIYFRTLPHKESLSMCIWNIYCYFQLCIW